MEAKIIAMAAADSVFAFTQLHYNQVAAMTFLTWDALVHISVEVECIWTGSRSWVNWIYAFIRYVPILHEGVTLILWNTTNLTASSCRAWLAYQSIFVDILIIATEVILTMRLYALYNRNKVVLGTILIAFLGEIALLVTGLYTLPQVQFDAPDCYLVHAPDMLMACWLSPLVFEAYLFALTMYAFCRSVMRNLGKRSILYVFVRDGTWAFIIVFVMMLTITLMYKLSTDTRIAIGYFWAVAVTSFAGSHVLLNIRRFSRQDSTDSISSIVFQRIEFHNSVLNRTDGEISVAVTPT